METKDKVEKLLDMGAHAFNSWETEFLSDMTDREEFTEKQEAKINDLYEKHFGKDDGKL